jgi:ribonuclease BN (tRNA processing enzyme)
MELIILGSGTGIPRLERAYPGHVLRLGGRTLLLDSGPGTVRRALNVGVDYRDIDGIFYTHLHADHAVDLVPFLFATKHTPGFVRHQPLLLIGPPGFRKFYQTYTDLFGTGITDVEYEINIREVRDESWEWEGIRIRTRPTRHTANSNGYRFEWQGKVLVYTGDTAVCDEVIDLAQNADLLLTECSFPDDYEVFGHLTPTGAGRMAAAARVKTLVLVHLYPPTDEIDVPALCRKEFDGKVIVGQDLMRLEL